MFNDNWQAHVVLNPGRVANSIYLARKREVGSREYLRADGSIVIVKDTVATKEDLEFTTLDDDQIRALMTAFDAHGIKRPDAGFTEGKLVAVERHLEDMRELVFKEKKK